MTKIKITLLYSQSPEIIVKNNAIFKLNDIIKQNKEMAGIGNLLFIVDKNFYLTKKQILNYLVESLNFKTSVEVIDSGELTKSLAGAEAIYQLCHRHSIKRNDCLVAIGGGTIADAVGFVAATYMRGISFINIPTTMMSCADPIIGKVGVNFLLHKNLVGTWFSPNITIIDVGLIKNDSSRYISTGIAEIIKSAFLSDKQSVDNLKRDMQKLLLLDNHTLEKYFTLSIQIKIKNVKWDEKDTRGFHAKLSFGHTFADVLETFTPFGLMTHGESVALGMIFAARANDLIENSGRSHELLRKVLELIAAANLPVKLPLKISAEKVVENLLESKKSRDNSVTLVLLKNYGVAKVQPKISTKIIKQALKILY